MFPAELVKMKERCLIEVSINNLVVRLDWHSSGGDNLCKILDALHMASHFMTDD